MTQKIALTIKSHVTKATKKYALKIGTSPSTIIKNHLKTFSTPPAEDENLNLILKSLKGAFKLPKDFNYRRDLAERLSEKYT